MTVIRFFFGLGEAGAFPIATRSLSRWLLPGERGLAQGLTHAGSRLGAALTPPLVVYHYYPFTDGVPHFLHLGHWVLYGARSGLPGIGTRPPNMEPSIRQNAN